MTYDANSLTDWQSCRRKYHLNDRFRYVKWQPKDLLDACLRMGITAMSSENPPKDTPGLAKELKAKLMQAAANPGLDLNRGSNPYDTAKDLGAMLDTILRAIAMMPLLVTKEKAPVYLTDKIQWRFLSGIDESGTFHRWITASRWDEAHLFRHMHSWQLFADMAIARAPLHLHVIVIGQERNGRRSSAWARGFRHPAINSRRMRFKARTGMALKTWIPEYLADQADPDPDAWVRQLYEEGCVADLIHHQMVNCPEDSICESTRSQIVTELQRIEESAFNAKLLKTDPWLVEPMSHNACDAGGFPCVFQKVCWATGVNPRDVGYYQTRKAQREALVV